PAQGERLVGEIHRTCAHCGTKRLAWRFSFCYRSYQLHPRASRGTTRVYGTITAESALPPMARFRMEFASACPATSMPPVCALRGQSGVGIAQAIRVVLSVGCSQQGRSAYRQSGHGLSHRRWTHRRARRRAALAPALSVLDILHIAAYT